MARRLHILQVTPTYAPCVGGAERLLQAVSERLAARGHDVTVFAFNGSTQPEVVSARGGNLPAVERIAAVRVRRFSPDAAAGRALRWWSRQPGGWRSASAVLGDGLGMALRRPNPIRLVPAILRERADVVVSANWIWPAAYAAHLARRLRRFPLVGVPIFHISRPWSRSPLFERMLRACDATIALTAAERQFITETGAHGPVEVAGAGIDAERYRGVDGAALRARLGLGDRLVVGFIGRQDPLKGATTLIAAMRNLWERGRDVVLLLAGQSAHRSPEVDAALACLKPADRARVVLLDDFTERDAPSVPAVCDVVAVPSVEEAFGLVYLEAWMCGRPVIGARIPSSSCVIDPGEDGLLAEPLDPASLTQCLETLLADRGLRDRMGQRGRAKTLSRHTWTAVTERWEELLLRVSR